jgi:hypothetical protein
MNPAMNSIASPARIRSDLAELQNLLMQSRQQQVHEVDDRQQVPWQQVPWQHNMMLWDQRIPYQAEHDFNRGSIPSFNNLRTAKVPNRRLSNFSSVESSPYGMSRVKSLGHESLSRMNISSPNLSLKKVAKRNSGGGGFPMPRLGDKATKKRPELLNFALSVARVDQSRRTARSQQTLPPLRKSHGCFPLPKLRPVKSSFKKPYSLASYKELWVASQDGEVSREIFARRLHRGALSSS